MINKKLYLILASVIGVGQVLTSEIKENPYGADIEKIVIPDLYIPVQGKLTFFSGGETDEAVNVRNFLLRIKSNIPYYLEQVANDYERFLAKSVTLKNSLSFTKKYKENIEKYLADEKKVISLASNANQIVKKLSQAIKDWENSLAGWIFGADEEAQEKAMKDTQQYVNELAQSFKQIQTIAKSLADEVASFDQRSKDDILVKEHDRKKAQNVEEKTKKAENALKRAQEQVITASQAASAAAGGPGEPEAEENLRKAEAEEKRESLSVRAAKKIAKYQEEKATLEARQAEEIAKLIAQNAQEKEKAVSNRQQKTIEEEMSSLLETRLEAVRTYREEIIRLTEKVIDNPSDYSPEFVSAIDTQIIPEFKDLTKNFSEHYDYAEEVLTRLTSLEKEIEKQRRSYSETISQNNKTAEVEALKTLKSLELQRDDHVTLISAILKKANEDKVKLYNLLEALQAAEKRVSAQVAEEKASQASDAAAGGSEGKEIARVLNPKEIERALELAHAVKIKVEAMKRMYAEKQKEMIARVVELARAVKLTTPTASMAAAAAAGGGRLGTKADYKGRSTAAAAAAGFDN